MSGIAPSERHLEDWIVAHPDRILPSFWGYDEIDTPMISRILKRQPRFPHGRPDLIIESRFNICVIELKKGAIDANTVMQCHRYLHDVEAICFARHLDMTDCYQNDLKYIGNLSIGDGIHGILIGHHIADENLLIACKRMAVSIVLYEWDGNDYHFRFIPMKMTGEHSEARYEWAKGQLGDAGWKVTIRKHEWEKDQGYA